MSFTLHPPAGDPLPLVLDSPHSGNAWPADWHPVAPHEVLETSWDAYVAELFGGAPARGAALLEAHFPRSFIDLNRARRDIDPAMLDGEMQGGVAPTGYSGRGFGLLRRFALPGVPVYGGPLPAAQVAGWVARYYDPYHAALAGQIDALHARFGAAFHIDCHSMKSRGNAMNTDVGRPRPDFVVSDLDGQTSEPGFTRFVADCLSGMGYTAWVNDPYKGAELIARHSDPARNRHSIQIEVNRALYLDEASRERGPRFAEIRSAMDRLLDAVAGYVRR